MSDYKLAKKSLGEEKKAVKDYTKRKEQSKSPQLKKAFSHAIPEEREHAKLFKKASKSYSQGAIKSAKKQRTEGR